MRACLPDTGVKQKVIEMMTAHMIHITLSADVLRLFSGSRARRYSVVKKHWTD